MTSGHLFSKHPASVRITSGHPFSKHSATIRMTSGQFLKCANHSPARRVPDEMSRTGQDASMTLYNFIYIAGPFIHLLRRLSV